MLNTYFDNIQEILKTVENKEEKAMKLAAEKIAGSIQQEGVIHLFGCGHSHILAEEVYYRAGGLVPVHPILHEALMLHQGAQESSALERKSGYALGFMELEDIREGDVIIVVSTSGRNPVPVEAAHIAKEKKAFVIGITSVDYSKSQPSRDPSGDHLYDAVDLVIDNHAPAGDALLSHPNVSVNFAPSSTVVGSAIINAVFAEAVALMAEAGFEPPVFLSGNIDGADEHNRKLIEKYGERISL